MRNNYFTKQQSYVGIKLRDYSLVFLRTFQIESVGKNRTIAITEL